jgi:hypothetical protein
VAFDISVDVSEVLKASDLLGRIDKALVGTTAVKSVNKVVERTYALAEVKMLSGINLTQADFQEGMRKELASDPLKPEGAVVGLRKSVRSMTMRRFFIELVLEANRWQNSFVAQKAAQDLRTGNARSKNKPFPWKLRKGDPARKIAPGNKAVCMAVEVTKGRRVYAKNWVLIRGRNGLWFPAKIHKGADKKWGRKGNTNFEFLYGPSIWQLFKAQIPGMRDQVRADLVKTLSDDVRDEFLKVLKS